MVEARVRTHANGIRDLAAAGDEAFGRLLRQGIPDALEQAIAELASSALASESIPADWPAGGRALITKPVFRARSGDT